jgi:hypothetical protein
MLQAVDFKVADVIRNANGCAVIQMGEWTTRLLGQLHDTEVSPDKLHTSLLRLESAGVTRLKVWNVIFAGGIWIRDNGEFAPTSIDEGPVGAEVILLDVGMLESCRPKVEEKVYAETH